MFPPFCHEAAISRLLQVIGGGEDGAQRGAVTEGAQHGRVQSALGQRGAVSRCAREDALA